jgi:AGCS family alanine or glycine:cation symporter
VIVPNLIGVLLLTDKIKDVTDDYLERKPWLTMNQGEER